MLTLIFGILPTKAFRLESSMSESLTPKRSVTQNSNGLTVSYEFPGAIAIQDDIYPDCYNIDIPGFGRNHNLCEPAWPIRMDSFEIPVGYEAQVSVIGEKWIPYDFPLAPSRPLLEDSSNEIYSTDNVPPVTDFTGILPKKSISISDVQIYRDRNILYVTVIPTRSENNKQTEICENLSYRVDFIASKTGKSNATMQTRHDVDDDLMQSLFTFTLSSSNIGLDRVVEKNQWKKAPSYLILSTSKYKQYVDSFVEWKKLMGFNTEARYSSSWTETSIKSVIKSAYDAIPSLSYVLLIGDAKTLPPVNHPKNGGSPYAHYSDYTYGCMDGDNDMEQDIIIGRLNVSNASEAEIVINKIISYEKNPPTIDSFYTNATHSAYFQDEDKTPHYEDRRFIKTSEDIRTGLWREGFNINRIYCTNSWIYPTHYNSGTYSFGEPIHPELLKPNFNWDGSTDHVVNSINSGTFYFLHRGHGSSIGMADPSFKVKDISRLNNGSLLPVVFSINCQTGAFSNTPNNISSNPTFSEALIRHSSGGAVAVISASATSYSGRNDVLVMEMFQAIWPSTSIMTTFPKYMINDTIPTSGPIYRIGDILQKGKAGLVERYDGSYIDYTKRIFHCFGDPTMNMYTRKPHSVTVFSNNNYPYIISTNEKVQISIILKDGSVVVSGGTNFDLSYYKDEVSDIMIHGPNIIPSKSSIGNIGILAEKNYHITSVDVDKGYIDIQYQLYEDDEATIILCPVSNFAVQSAKFRTNECNISIPTETLSPGVYVIELIVNNSIVDSRKVII